MRCLVVAVVAVLGGTLTAAETQRPNVLLILADDLGYSELGCMGGEIPTPNVDRLAAGGLRFTQCYNSARCCPSRASLMTGLYPHQAGIGSFAQSQPDPVRGPAYLGHLNDRCVTLAEVLGDAGYRNYMVGKWHMEEPGPIARGFDEFYGFVKGYEQDQWDPARYVRLPEGREPELQYAEGEFYATDVFTDYALEFLRQARNANGRPWFLYVAHSSPHFPLQAPNSSVEKFVEVYRRGWDALREERFARMKETGLADESWTLPERSLVPVDREDIANGFSGEQNPAWDSLPEDRREDLARRMAVYAAMVWHIDRGVGRILEDLESHDELDNTLILFLSDNGACYEWGPFGFDGPSRRGVTILHKGEALETMGGPGTYHSYGSGWANLGNTPFRLYKHFTHEGGNCTPLLVHWPAGVKRPDRWVRDPVHVMDIMPTLCDACDAEYPEEFQGRTIQPTEGQSLAPLFGDGVLPDRVIASEHNGARSLRRGKWKVVWPVRMPWESRWELYDLSADRCEQNDLAQQRPKLTQELADAWMAWAKRVKVHPFFQAANESDAKSPQVANRPLTISCRVTLPDGDTSGVLLAQGGNQHGYALHIEDGRLHFSVRVHQEVTAIEAPLGREDAFTVEATLERGGAMVLSIDGEAAAEGKAPGLIPVEPVDALSIGFDDRSAVGRYQSPFQFAGQVEQVRIEPLAEPAAERINVVVLLADDMTYTDLGCFGNKNVRTPHLDRLARQGMKLTRCFSPAPMCAPARMSLYTGLYPVRNGAHPNHSRVKPNVESLPHYLKALGYRVGILGKRHEKPGDAFPFESLGGRHHDGGKGADLDVEKIRPFLRRDPRQPYCLVVASNQPHEPWNRGDASAYDPQSLELPPYMVDTPATREALARYYAEITYFDEQVGQVLKAVEEDGRPDRTLVLFFSEQGSSFPHCKWTCYDTGLRAAALARWPGVIAEGSASDAMIQYVDVVPTLVEVAGGDASQFDFDGESFLKALRGETSSHRDYVFGVQTSRGIHRGPEAYGVRSVRGSRYKLIWNLFPENRFQNMVTEASPIFQSWKDAARQGNEFAAERVRWYQHRPEFELYDLENDPFELSNLADDPRYSEQRRKLRQRLLAWMEQQGDEGRATEMQALERQGKAGE